MGSRIQVRRIIFSRWNGMDPERGYHAAERELNLPKLSELQKNEFVEFWESLGDGSEKPVFRRPPHDPAGRVTEIETPEGHSLLLTWAGADLVRMIIHLAPGESGLAICEYANDCGLVPA